MQTCWLLFVLVPPGTIHARPICQRDILDSLLGVQKENAKRFTVGSMKVVSTEITRQIIAGKEEAVLTYTSRIETSWNGPTSFMDYRQTNQKTSKSAETNESESGTIIIKDDKCVWYLPKRDFVGVYDVKRMPIHSVLRVLPQDVWYKPSSSWLNLLGGNVEFEKSVPMTRTASIEGQKVRVAFTFLDPTGKGKSQKGYAIFDLEKGGNATEFLFHAVDQNISGMKGVYDWQELGNGSWALKSMTIEIFMMGKEKSPDRVQSLVIEEFAAAPKVDLAGLSLEGLKLPQGTQVHDLTTKKRYYIGGQPKRVPAPSKDALLKKMAEKLQAKGFGAKR